MVSIPEEDTDNIEIYDDSEPEKLIATIDANKSKVLNKIYLCNEGNYTVTEPDPILYDIKNNGEYSFNISDEMNGVIGAKNIYLSVNVPSSSSKINIAYFADGSSSNPLPISSFIPCLQTAVITIPNGKSCVTLRRQTGNNGYYVVSYRANNTGSSITVPSSVSKDFYYLFSGTSIFLRFFDENKKDVFQIQDLSERDSDASYCNLYFNVFNIPLYQ